MAANPFADPKAIAALMEPYPRPWAFCGGWAIDLFLARATRAHEDVDVAAFRRDQLDLQAFLHARGWRLDVAHKGRLRPWRQGEALELPLHTIWCRKGDHKPGFFEVLLNEAVGEVFCFRRDPSIRLELRRALRITAEDWPYLSPEIVLLYKSNHPAHAGNAADFARARPALDGRQAAWLRGALERNSASHPWIEALG